MKNLERKKKLVFLINDFLIGGAQRIILDIVGSINKNLFEIHLVYIKSHANYPGTPDLLEEMKMAGAKVVGIEGDKKFSIQELIRLVKTLKELQPDILHTFLPYAGILGRIVGRLFGIKNIVSTQCNLPSVYTKKVYLLDKYTLSLATIWTAAALAIEEAYGNSIAFFSKRLWQDGRRHFSVLAGADIPKIDNLIIKVDKEKKRSELGFTKDDIVVMTISRLIYWKGNSGLIKAMKYLSENIHLIIVGYGPLYSELKLEAKELGVEKRIHLLKGQKDIYGLFAASDIYIQNYSKFFDGKMWMGPNTSQMEACAAGLPSISANVPYIETLISDNLTGKLAEPDNPESIAGAIQWMIDNKPEAVLMAARAKEKVRSNFSVSAMVNNYENIYKSL